MRPHTSSKAPRKSNRYRSMSLIGEAEVIEVPEDCLVIDEEFVSAKCAPGTEAILFKTRNSAFWSESKPEFHTDFTYLDLEAATKLVQQGANWSASTICRSKSLAHARTTKHISHCFRTASSSSKV